MSDSKKTKEVTLDDVKPLHPNDYPAKHLKEKLDGRKEELSEIKNHASSQGLADGPENA